MKKSMEALNLIDKGSKGAVWISELYISWTQAVITCLWHRKIRKNGDKMFKESTNTALSRKKNPILICFQGWLIFLTAAVA